MAGAGSVSAAAASGSRARRAIPGSPSTVLCRTAPVTVVWKDNKGAVYQNTANIKFTAS